MDCEDGSQNEDMMPEPGKSGMDISKYRREQYRY